MLPLFVLRLGESGVVRPLPTAEHGERFSKKT